MRRGATAVVVIVLGLGRTSLARGRGVLGRSLGGRGGRRVVPVPVVVVRVRRDMVDDNWPLRMFSQRLVRRHLVLYLPVAILHVVQFRYGIRKCCEVKVISCMHHWQTTLSVQLQKFTYEAKVKVTHERYFVFGITQIDKEIVNIGWQGEANRSIDIIEDEGVDRRDWWMGNTEGRLGVDNIELNVICIQVTWSPVAG